MKLISLCLNSILVRRLSMAAGGVRCLTQEEAIKLDQELFTEYSFSVDQLMELAGLSVAAAVQKMFSKDDCRAPVVCCGPGNNGGDGNQLYQNLMKQCEKFDIPVIQKVPEEPLNNLGDLVIDAIFGFSFKAPNRNADFAKLIRLIDLSGLPVFSVDIPSGWDVNKGRQDIDLEQSDLDPQLKLATLMPVGLISLTAPKFCSSTFNFKHHYLGGRFVPKSIRDKYRLNLPEFSEAEQVVLLSSAE